MKGMIYCTCTVYKSAQELLNPRTNNKFRHFALSKWYKCASQFTTPMHRIYRRSEVKGSCYVLDKHTWPRGLLHRDTFIRATVRHMSVVTICSWYILCYPCVMYTSSSEYEFSASEVCLIFLLLLLFVWLLMAAVYTRLGSTLCFTHDTQLKRPGFDYTHGCIC
jgi:hypothetical protein